MIIDQLPSISLPVLGNDEMPVERGQLTYKATVDDIVNSGSLPTIPRPNLLDNWYFVGGGSQQGGGQFPINQRGQTSYTGAVYGIDRWKQNANNKMEIISTGLVISSIGATSRGFSQVISNPTILAGKTVTLSILVVASDGDGTFGTTESQTSVSITGSGLFTRTFTFGTNISTLSVNGNAGVNGHSMTIAAVKLELGTTQTLAHQENGTWVLNEVPNYAEEMLKCISSHADSTDTFAGVDYSLYSDRFPILPVSDLNAPPSILPSLLITNTDTLNTPYKAGLVGGNAGFCFSYQNSANYGIQLYFVSGNSTKLLIRSKASGTWGNWAQIASS